MEPRQARAPAPPALSVRAASLSPDACPGVAAPPSTRPRPLPSLPGLSLPPSAQSAARRPPEPRSRRAHTPAAASCLRPVRRASCARLTLLRRPGYSSALAVASSTSPYGRPPATAIAAVGSPWRALSGPIPRLQTAAPKPARPARGSSTPRLGESPPPPPESGPRHRLRAPSRRAGSPPPRRLPTPPRATTSRGKGSPWSGTPPAAASAPRRRPYAPAQASERRAARRVPPRREEEEEKDSANEGPTQKQSRTQWPEDEPVHPVPEDGVSLIKPSLFQGVAWGKASQPDKLTVA
ncbi:hypothetical protein U9M48_006415 [Paspalum notatum var. saurae]|uniref:Uncharacterized protein n=1 Tax=Paspalum notatum var. saurae TaxID=547442 RepID=A0AAQ3PNZ8_PASNO